MTPRQLSANCRAAISAIFAPYVDPPGLAAPMFPVFIINNSKPTPARVKGYAMQQINPDPVAVRRAAKDYIRRGWNPLPVRPPEIENPDTGKKPICNNWQKSVTKAADISKLWPDSTPRNIGIVCGISRLVVLDFDNPEAYPIWAAAHPDAVKTFTVKRSNAPEGRVHLYFALAPGQATPRQLVMTQTGWGDLKSGPSQVITAPSIHYTGGRYEVLEDISPIQWADEYTPAPFKQKNDLPEQKAGDVTEISEIAEIAEKSEKTKAIGGIASPISGKLTPEQAIELTQPKEQGERNACIFNLARALKFNCDLKDVQPLSLRPYVVAWHKKAQAIIKTKEFMTTWADFLVGFEKANYKMGGNPVNDALILSEQKPPKYPEHYTQPYRVVYGILFYLAKANNGNFFLSTHDRVLINAMGNCSPMTIHRILSTIRLEGILAIIQKGIRGGHKATRYKWTGPNE